MTVPQPEPRGYPGNLGLLFAEHAQSDRPAIIDLYDPGRPRAVSFRELDAACNARRSWGQVLLLAKGKT